ncbi:MAG: enoyl-CoA hydratase/isomerase family protein [Burkholderiales bacterium]
MSDTEFKPNPGLIVERQAAITLLTIDRTSRANALDAALVEALHVGVDSAQANGSRLLVLAGNGKNFSAGFDMSEIDRQSEGDLLLRMVRIEQLLQRVHHAPCATLAFAQGRNFGAGADLVLAASTRLCAPDATFRMPGLRFGLQLGTRRLAARIGAEAARAMLEASQTIDAERALGLGFVSAIAPRETWPDRIAQALERATSLASDATRRLADATTADTRAIDMADLVASASTPGFKARMQAYRDARAST